jgi:hypothetical protein
MPEAIVIKNDSVPASDDADSAGEYLKTPALSEMPKYPSGFYKGVPLYKKARPLQKTAKEVIVEAVLTDEQMEEREGQYFDEKDAPRIFDEDVDVYTKMPDGSKKLLAKLRKQVIDPESIKIGWEGFYMAAGTSRNRGAAAGPIDVKGKYWSKRKPVQIDKWGARYMQNGKVSKMRVNNLVFSSVLGYFEETHFMGLPCRLTSYTMRYFKYYKHGLPFIRELDRCFKTLVPERYKLQRAAAQQKPLLHIDGTAFSSVTINRNFRTALHQDDGDFRQGYGNLSVIERGNYQGGYTIFPRYGVGFNVRTGDFIAMDVHEWHCNTAMRTTKADDAVNKTLPRIFKDDPDTGAQGAEEPYTRISFVCYLREKLRNCKNAQTRKYFQKIGFNPKKLTLAPARKTRKVKAT